MSAPNDADRRAEGAPPSPSSAFQERLAVWGRRAREVASELGRRERLLEIVTVIALLAGLLLVVSDFTNLFNAETHRRGIFQQQSGGENHAYALVVVGLAIVGASLLARATEAWPPGAGVAALGALALAIALIVDLPDATSSGLTTSVESGNADPAIGFWLELAGALIALLSGLVLVYLLQSLRSSSAQRPAPRSKP